MVSSNKILSQADIDSLVSIQVDEPPAMVKAVEAASLHRSPRDEPRTSASTGAAHLEEVVARLEERLDVVEDSVKRTLGPDKASPETSAAIGDLYQGLRAISEYVQRLSGKVDDILGNLQATPGYALQKTFTCRSCNSSGVVAIIARCTRCEDESWWGWTPQGQ